MTDSTGSPSGGGGMGAEELFDLTIIGGGPVGLFASFYAGLRQMKTKIIDSLEELGGQLTTLYPEKFIFDVAGFPKVLARDLAHQLIQQAMQANPAVALGETVRHLEPLGDAENPRYRIVSDKGSHLTRTLMICAGAGAFSPKKLRIPEAPALENRGLHYACRSKAVFAGKRVLIVGGGDSAVDWSLNLRDTAESITLIHRRNQFRAHEESVRQLQATDVKILTFFEIKSLVGGGGEQGLTAAVIENSQTKEVRTLEVDAVLVQIGFDTSLGPIKEWPLKVERGQIQVNSHMETALPGVFAAGDVAAYEGKLKLIATGFGEAAMAVNFAKVRVDPKAKFFPGHSSEMTAQHESVVTV
ncbi:MAG TPA: NAD(P)/FAD-dependent oxidoreductase [Phycisphaerae bacterium]|nr:NAD(P)/FAD-dependent oxidoreductase [Phycisphaerae bacterium]